MMISIYIFTTNKFIFIIENTVHYGRYDSKKFGSEFLCSSFSVVEQVWFNFLHGFLEGGGHFEWPQSFILEQFPSTRSEDEKKLLLLL